MEHFSNYAREVVETIKPKKEELVIDIGSNDGTLLQSFRGYGLRVLGIEPAEHIAKKATENGTETMPNFFTSDVASSIRERYGKAKIITANNVLSNIDDLGHVIDNVHDLLTPDGVFITEVFYLGDLIKNMVFDYIYHEHLDYHSIIPLKYFLENHKMQLLDVKEVPTKCGSLRCIIQRSDGPHKEAESVMHQITKEKERGLHEPGIFSEFNKKIISARRNLEEILERSEKKKIAAYGASITCTALTYHFDLGRHFSFIVDDNPTRQGLYSPGLHRPVLSPELFYERKMDAVLILAWRYADSIIKKNKSFLERGGQFVIPLPEARIIS